MIDLAKLTSEKLADSYEQDGEWTVDTLYAIAQSSSISDDIGLQVLDARGPFFTTIRGRLHRLLPT